MAAQKIAVKFDSDFEFSEYLGYGSFGIVFSVKPKIYCRLNKIHKNDTFALKFSAVEDEEALPKHREYKIYKAARKWDSKFIVKQFYQWQDILPVEEAKKRYNEIRKEVTNITKEDVPSLHKWAKSDRVKGPSHMYFAFFLMELCQRSLRELIDGIKVEMKSPGVTKMPNNEIFKCMQDILCGLIELHTKYKIIHRDVKPGNILHGFDGYWKLADFSVSSRLLTSSKNNSKHYTFTWTDTAPHQNPAAGTAAYRAPEVCKSSQAQYDEKVDIFSLGMTLIDTVISFGIDSNNWNYKMEHIRHGGTDSSEMIVQGFEKAKFPIEYAKFTQKLVEPDPKDRPTSQEALKRIESLPEVIDPTIVHEAQNDTSNNSDQSYDFVDSSLSNSSRSSSSLSIVIYDDVSIGCMVSEILKVYWKENPRVNTYKCYEKYNVALRTMLSNPESALRYSITEQQQKVHYYYFCDITGISAERTGNKRFILRRKDGSELKPAETVHELMKELTANRQKKHWQAENLIPGIPEHSAENKSAVQVKISSRNSKDSACIIRLIPAIPIAKVEGDISTDLHETINLCEFFKEEEKEVVLQKKVLLVPEQNSDGTGLEWQVCISPALFNHMHENVGYAAGIIHGLNKTFHNHFTSIKHISPFILYNVLLMQLKRCPHPNQWEECAFGQRLIWILEEWQGVIEQRKLLEFFFPNDSENLFRQDLSDGDYLELISHVKNLRDNLIDEVTEVVRA